MEENSTQNSNNMEELKKQCKTVQTGFIQQYSFNNKCPNCGYCPACGQSNWPYNPYRPYIWC